MKEDKDKIGDVELSKILEVLAKAYEAKGKKLKTATLLVKDKKPEILIDNRKPEENN